MQSPAQHLYKDLAKEKENRRTHDKITVNVGSNFERRVVLQGRPELLQALKAKIGVSRNRWAVLVAIGWSRCNNGERVVRGGHSRRLNLSPQYVIDER